MGSIHDPRPGFDNKGKGACWNVAAAEAAVVIALVMGVRALVKK
jgi:hypothetical protein